MVAALACGGGRKAVLEAHAMSMSAARGKRYVAMAQTKLDAADQVLADTEDEEMSFPYLWEAFNNVRLLCTENQLIATHFCRYSLP
jgi:hypothetical protein